MFAPFFLELRAAGLPVSLKEYLALLAGMEAGVAAYSVEDFYYLSRSALVKDERHLDRFDRVFGHCFRGVVEGGGSLFTAEAKLPAEWLRKLAELHLTDEEKARIEALGGWEELMEAFRRRLQEQEERHQGGSHWIGTAGTSPFGAHGYHPEGIRLGQGSSRHRQAVKVWDRRDFRELADDVELGTRNVKLALRRLRRFAREGAATELDLPGTIRSTADNAGWLQLEMVPERHNAVKVLLLVDHGGSMDDHVRVCEELFSAVRSEFKHLEHYYFHNCLYERVWKESRLRFSRQAASTWELIHTYGADYKVILVGDATMSPYEITMAGGSVDHWNEEPGVRWMERLLEHFRRAVWLNPQPREVWPRVPSIRMIREMMDQRMFPLTLEGLDGAMRELGG